MFTLNSSENLTVNVKPMVKIKTNLDLIGTKTTLPIEIVADFTDVPESMRESYLSAFKYQYMGSVKIYSQFNDEKPSPKNQQKNLRTNKFVNLISSLIKKIKW